MIAAESNYRQWQILLNRVLSASALPVAALVIGCLCGFGALYVYAWLSVNPGCHCPVDKIYLARRTADQFWPAAALLSAVLSLGFFQVGRKIAMPERIQSPSVASLAIAFLVYGLLGFIPAASGRFSNIPVEWVAPEQLLNPVRWVSQTVQSWRFLIFVVPWSAVSVILRYWRGPLSTLRSQRSHTEE